MLTNMTDTNKTWWQWFTTDSWQWAN